MPRSQILFNNLENKKNDDAIIINQNDSEEELKEIIKEICSTIGENLYKIKTDFKKSQQLLQKNYYKNENSEYFMNSNFEEIELIEENLDNLFHKFYEIKKEIAKARLAKHYIEIKANERECIYKKSHCRV
jgi:SMC interacting uncharacterized protein involved in chromosome segregation